MTNDRYAELEKYVDYKRQYDVRMHVCHDGKSFVLPMVTTKIDIIFVKVYWVLVILSALSVKRQHKRSYCTWIPKYISFWVSKSLWERCYGTRKWFWCGENYKHWDQILNSNAEQWQIDQVTMWWKKYCWSIVHPVDMITMPSDTMIIYCYHVIYDVCTYLGTLWPECGIH